MSGDALLHFLLSTSADPWTALAAKATLTMAGALLVVGALRRAPASLRHLLAAAAFGALLLLPLVATWGPSHVVTVAAIPLPSRAARAEGETRAPAPRAVTEAPSAVLAAPRPTPRPSMGAIVGGLYGAGVLAVLASLLAGVARLYRLRDRSEVSVGGTRLANAIARREGARIGIEVLTSHELAAPLTFGSARPVILLPAEAGAWDEGEMARALRHEIEHVARRDWAIQIAARVAFALYWAHPLAWMLWRRLRLEAERACDDAVIRSQGQPETYAGQLVALARRVHGHVRVPALPMAMRSDLGLRVEAILDAATPRAPRTRLAIVAALAVASFSLATLAPVRLARAAARDAEAAGAPVRMSQVHRERHADEHRATDPSAKAARKGAEDDADDDRIEVDVDSVVDHEVDVEVDSDVDADVQAEIEAMADVHVDVDVESKVDVDKDVHAEVNVDLDDDDDRDDSLDMRLMKAAERGSLVAMRGLIDAGAKPGAVLTGDGSPLIAAARGGHVDAIELLLQAGADVDRGVEGDGSPLIAAAQEGHLDAVRALVARGASIDKGVRGDGNALIMAAGAGHEDVVRFLLDSGAGIETVVPGDENALIAASEGGQAHVVKFLIDRGADVNARVKAIGPNGRVEYRTALSMARRRGHEEVERILRKAGARD
jgi:beta-lactamase regulating signal transducer with metallopeptidase domain/ankyrin repeat protein